MSDVVQVQGITVRSNRRQALFHSLSIGSPELVDSQRVNQIVPLVNLSFSKGCRLPPPRTNDLVRFARGFGTPRSVHPLFHALGSSRNRHHFFPGCLGPSYCPCFANPRQNDQGSLNRAASRAVTAEGDGRALAECTGESALGTRRGFDQIGLDVDEVDAGALGPVRGVYDLSLVDGGGIDVVEVETTPGELDQGVLEALALATVLVTDGIDELAEVGIVLTAERLSAEARIQPRGIGQKRRIVLCIEVVGEVEVASPRLGRGIGLEEAPVTWVVLSGSQVVEAGVGIQVLTGETDRVGGGLVSARAKATRPEENI